MPALTTFTPGEAEQITGVSAVRQRDYRRHGYLPSGDGHARFDAFSLARLWSFALLGAQGIGPKVVFENADLIAQGIVHHAVCIAHDDTLARRVLRKHGLGGVIPGRFCIFFPDGSDPHFDESVDRAIGSLSPDAAKRLGLPASAEVIGRAKRDHSVAGAIVVLDLRNLGEMLVQRAGRPLVGAA